MSDFSSTISKACPECSTVKPLVDFYRDKSKPDGLTRRCKECTKASVNQWRKQNLEKARKQRRKSYYNNREHALAYGEKWRQANPDKVKGYYEARKDEFKQRRKGRDYFIKSMLKSAQNRAIDEQLPFDLTIEYLQEIATMHCPVTGDKLDWNRELEETSKRNSLVPSLDKIVPSRGYVKGNVAIISWRMNVLKSDMTTTELQQLLDYVRANT